MSNPAINSESGQAPATPSPQFVVLGHLLQLEKQARHADSAKALAYIAVNESNRLFPYQQAVLWSYAFSGGIEVQAVSGSGGVDKHAPFIRWLLHLINEYNRDVERARKLQVVDAEKLPETIRRDWNEWSQGDLLWCPLIHPDKTLVGGLLFFRRQNWREGELTLAERLCDAYAHAWGTLRGTRRKHGGYLRKLAGIMVLCFMIGGLFLPVHESVLAPAEVIARDPLLVTSPMEGVVQEMYVKPNQPVQTGDKLLKLEDTVHKNRYVIAQKSLDVSRAKLLNAEQKAFSDRNSKSELALLRSKLEESRAELEYVAELLGRLEVKAEKNGIAVFPDVNDWLGKPVRVGEKIMVLADPEHTELEMWVPVADAINMTADARVLLFLNTDPTRPHEAKVYQTAYEAQVSPGGTLAFRIKARFTGADARLRLGLKGTGKIYGEQVRMYYYLFRRPWATVRQWLGM